MNSGAGVSERVGAEERAGGRKISNVHDGEGGEASVWPWVKVKRTKRARYWRRSEMQDKGVYAERASPESNHRTRALRERWQKEVGVSERRQRVWATSALLAAEMVPGCAAANPIIEL